MQTGNDPDAQKMDNQIDSSGNYNGMKVDEQNNAQRSTDEESTQFQQVFSLGTTNATAGTESVDVS